MAKKSQSFADKVARQGNTAKTMAKLIISEKKENGHYSFRTRMVPAENAKEELAKAKS